MTRVAIASRIFEPEPSAASFRLQALASALVTSEHDTTVLTVKPPRRLAVRSHDAQRPYRVKRFPVLRDRTGYVRGYVQYLSFDVPLFARILFGPRYDAIVVEPPPTTAFFVRIAAALRRVPYVYYAADIWSDAAAQTGSPRWIIRLVRGLEKFALRGASAVLSVSEGVTRRLKQLDMSSRATTIGNGIDVTAFGRGTFLSESPEPAATFVYAGTASEWHGAEVFIDALPEVLRAHPEARILYIGGGSEREALRSRAAELGVTEAVSFEDVRPPSELGPELRRACAALASVRPGSGYDFAFPTKLYSGAACGAPLIYAGIGPAVDFVRTEVDGRALGEAVPADASSVATAMIETAGAAFDPGRRQAVANWAATHVSLDAVAIRAVQTVESVVSGTAKRDER
ncbi:glycosyltransferase family 4 protein [Microbacterium sp.]|uniref:glycosyltransferase family 4 protein n=1 Tax=Microbacterium sp. TaxID=51671 RepID=UPI003A925D7C